MDTNIKELEKRVEQFCKNPGPLFLDENESLLIDLLKATFLESDYNERNRLLQLLSLVRLVSETEVSEYARRLHSIAHDEYTQGNLDFAEYLFRSACNINDDTTYCNNLAYVLRRKNSDSLNMQEVISLLLPGVEKRDPFCLINMGLVFAISLSAQKDWKTADELFSQLPEDLNGADHWWEQLGEENDPEGFLVHFFLLRHRKIKNSSLGTINDLSNKLNILINTFPDWMRLDDTTNDDPE